MRNYSPYGGYGYQQPQYGGYGVASGAAYQSLLSKVLTLLSLSLLVAGVGIGVGMYLLLQAGTASFLLPAIILEIVALIALMITARVFKRAAVLNLGLATAIRSAAARASQRIVLELPVEIDVDGRAEETAYYVFLEAITNAQKHAPETVVGVHVRVYDTVLAISVSDEGPGGASEAPGGGLAGLRKRVEEGGGTFHVQSLAGRGTTVTAAIPL